MLAEPKETANDPRIGRECFDCGASARDVATGKRTGIVILSEKITTPLGVYKWSLCAGCAEISERARAEQRAGEELDRKAKAAKLAKEAG